MIYSKYAGTEGKLDGEEYIVVKTERHSGNSRVKIVEEQEAMNYGKRN